jgi:hypothetical protein
MENTFKCSECKKYYKSYQSLWNHNKKFHNNINEIEPKERKEVEEAEETKETEEINNSLICKYCNKSFNHFQNKYRHQKICKIKKDLVTQIEEIKHKTEILEKKNKQLLEDNIKLKIILGLKN